MAAPETASPVTARLAADARSFTLDAPGVAGFRATWADWVGKSHHARSLALGCAQTAPAHGGNHAAINNGEDGLHLAWSADGLKWQALNDRMYSTTTTDFETFTPATLYFDPGHNVIDSTLTAFHGKTVMIYKDETKVPEPKKNLKFATATSPAGPFTPVPGNSAFNCGF